MSSSTAENAVVTAALKYARCGLPVFPCNPNKKAPDGRLAPNGFYSATTDLERIEANFKQNHNIAIAPPKNIVAIDVDMSKDKSIPEEKRTGEVDGVTDMLITNFTELARSPITKTPSGYHLFTRLPDGDWHTPGDWPPGDSSYGELKGNGVGYVVAPPSKVGPANGKPGGTYTELQPLTSLERIPEASPELMEYLGITRDNYGYLDGTDDQPIEPRKQTPQEGVGTPAANSVGSSATPNGEKRTRKRQDSHNNAVDMTDDELLDKARANKKTGAHFTAMYDHGDLSRNKNDHSRADMALIRYLAWWTTYDEKRTDDLFRDSKLMRPKWDRKATKEGDTVGELTISKIFATPDSTGGYRPGGTITFGPPSAEDADDSPQEKAAKAAAAAPNRRAAVTRLGDVEHETIEHLDDGRLMLGKVTVLSGDPGVGKTQIALAIAAKITVGQPIFPPRLSPGSHTREPGNVLALVGEDGLADTIRGRVDRAGGDPNRFYAITGVLYPDEQGNEQEAGIDLTQLDVLEPEIVKYRPTLIIVDPIQLYLGTGTDMHRANEVRVALGPIAKLAERYGAALLIVAHMNKGGGKAIYRTLGSIDFMAIARSGLIVGQLDGQLALAHSKANLTKPADTLTFNLDDGNLTWTGTSGASADEITNVAPAAAHNSPKLNEATEWLDAVLSNGGRLQKDIQELAEEDGHAWRTVRRASEDLKVKKTRVGGIGTGGSWEWSRDD